MPKKLQKIRNKIECKHEWYGKKQCSKCGTIEYWGQIIAERIIEDKEYSTAQSKYNFNEELEMKQKSLNKGYNNIEIFIEKLVELEKKWLEKCEQERLYGYRWHKSSSEESKIYRKHGQSEPSWSQPSFNAGKDFVVEEIEKEITKFKYDTGIKDYKFFFEFIIDAINNYSNKNIKF